MASGVWSYFSHAQIASTQQAKKLKVPKTATVTADI